MEFPKMNTSPNRSIVSLSMIIKTGQSSFHCKDGINFISYDIIKESFDRLIHVETGTQSNEERRNAKSHSVVWRHMYAHTIRNVQQLIVCLVTAVNQFTTCLRRTLVFVHSFCLRHNRPISFARATTNLIRWFKNRTFIRTEQMRSHSKTAKRENPQRNR